MIPRISALFLYPLKGASGIAVPMMDLDAVGPIGDRRWMLVDPDGVFLSQRSTPAMARLEITLESDGDAGRRFRVTHRDGPMTDAPSFPFPAAVGPRDADAAVDRSPASAGTGNLEGERIRVRIWNDEVDAVAPDPDADRWFSDVLGRPCRMVHLPGSSVRRTDPAWAPGGRVGLADGYPLLMISEESLAALNERLTTPLPMNRFRPNLVVSGAESPHAEDTWHRIRIGAVDLAGVRACARCTVTTVDQATGERSVEPLPTLAEYRKHGGKVYFGQNLVHVAKGRVRAGDAVQVLEAGDPLY